MTELPVFIHSGMPKTGTSVLQNCIVSGLKQGQLKTLCYPLAGRGFGIAHHAFARAAINRDVQVRDALTSELLISASQMKCSGVRCALISSEALSNAVGPHVVSGLIDYLRPLAEHFELRIVIVVREFASFFESMYLQQSRFGRLEKDFAAYMSQRGKWVTGYVRGLMALREEFGGKLVIQMQRADFDVLGFFESVMRLEPGQLTALRDKSPPTGKRSLKLQSCLAHLGSVEDRLGFHIDRFALMREADKRKIFSDDIDDYTLYAPGDFEQRWEEYRDISLRLGFSEYAAAFVAPPIISRPNVVLSTCNLSDSDYDSLRSICGIFAVRREE